MMPAYGEGLHDVEHLKMQNESWEGLKSGSSVCDDGDVNGSLHQRSYQT